MKLHALFLFIHLLAAVIWIGGMFFAHVCLRPAAMATLEPPLRLRLWQAVFARFFRWVDAAVVLILVSGAGMLHNASHAALPPGWHVMIGLGIIMMVIFFYVRLVLYRTLCHSLSANDIPAAAKAQNRIRGLVTINLALSTLVLASVTLGLVL